MAAQSLFVCLNELLDLLVDAPDCQLARHYGLERAAMALREWLEKLQLKGSLLVIVIVGEFKAGKSSLVNAIFERNVAFSDPFAATMTSAAYYPDSQEFVLLKMENGDNQRTTLNKYLEDCKARRLHQVVQADVHFRHHHPYVLTDSPGLATVNQMDTDRAESAIKEADVIVWVIDPSDMLSAQEGAFLLRARKIGLPIIPVIGKADLLSDDEIEECKAYLSSRLGYQSDEFIVLSAERHSETKRDAGVLELVAALERFAQSPEATRSRAQSAKHREVLEEALRIANELQIQLSKEQKWADSERSIILHQERLLRERLLEVCKMETITAVRSHLANRVAASVPGNNLQAVCEQSLEGLGEQLQTISARIETRIQQEASAVWDQPFLERSADLQQQIEKLMKDSLSNRETIDFLTSQLQEVQARRTAVNNSIHGSTNKGSTAWETVIEIISTIVGAVSHSSVPVLVGKTINLIRNWIVGSSTQSQNVETISRDDCQKAICDALGEQLQEHTSASVKRYIRAIADDALDKLCVERFGGRSIHDIDAAKTRVDRVIRELNALSRKFC